MGRLRFSARARQSHDSHQQEHRETLLSHAMKIWRQEFADAVHQKPVRKIPVNVDVQLAAIWIEKPRQQRESGDLPKARQPSSNRIPPLPAGEVLDPAAD